MIAKIAVSAARFSIDKPYSYRFGPDMTLVPGLRVMVPIGSGNRRTEGVVLSLEQGDASGLKAVLQKQLLQILFLQGSGQLTGGNFLDGHGQGLLGQLFAELIGLQGDLAGALGNHIHQQITAIHLLQQVSNRGVQHR